jgi:biotin-dependent carboxylase-like uncharacterized protein
MNALTVWQPGLYTTLQDLGRDGLTHAGVSPGGAADPLSLRAANRLVSNPDDAPALEITLLGGTYTFERGAIVALTGGEFEASIPMWESVAVQPGENIRIHGARSGARAYLSVRGGFARPPLPARALRKGDVVEVGEAGVAPAKWGSRCQFSRLLRVTIGPQGEAFGGSAMFRFFQSTYTVLEDSNRLGLRLHGTPLQAPGGGQMPSQGVPLGAIQVPPSGQPIILFVDAQTTGGYPVIASVITADLPSVGQLRPRDEIQFQPVSLAEARDLIRKQEEWLDAVFGPQL